MKQYFPVFDRLRKEFLAGEMIWTLTDYNVLECEWKGWLKSLASPINTSEYDTSQALSYSPHRILIFSVSGRLLLFFLCTYEIDSITQIDLTFVSFYMEIIQWGIKQHFNILLMLK